MFENIYASSEFLLFRKNFNTFLIDDLENEKINLHLDKKLNDIDNNKYTCYFLIKNKDVIIASFSKKITKDNDITQFKNEIIKKTKLICKNDSDKITIEIGIFKNNDFKKEIQKLNKEFCNLEKLFNKDNDNYSFENINNLLFKNFIYIFLLITLFINLTIINFVSNLGIIIDFMSIETLTLIVYLYEKIYIIALTVLGGFSYIYIVLISFISFLILYFSNSADCRDYKEYAYLSFKSVCNLTLALFSVFIISQWYEYDENNSESNIFKDMIVTYIKETRSPSYRKIYIKEKDDETLKELNILILGENMNIINFLEDEDLKNIFNKSGKSKFNICVNDNYYKTLINILTLKYENNYLIRDSRFRILNKKNVTFSKDIIYFKDTICK